MTGSIVGFCRGPQGCLSCVGFRCTAWLLLLTAAAVPWQAFGQGIALRGISAVNESMGGAAVACPIDSAGALHWNPASISGLAASDMSFGMSLILPSSELSSSFMGMSGTDRSEPGVTPVPNMAFVRKIEGSPWAYGLSILGIGGTSVNYPASATNPILTPQATGLGGFGPLSANVDIVQMAPTVAYAITERVSVGVAPTLTMARLVANPLFLADTFPGTTVYPAGTGTRYIFGGGFQTGVYWTTESNWNFGASLKSPQWTEAFRYKSISSGGAGADSQTVKFHLNYPLILSVGTAYTGFEKWIIACDVRYFDYANTLGFNHSAPSGHAVTGLWWNNVMSVALGAQRQLTDCLSVRFGYSYNDNPIDSEAVTFNIASPLIIQHTVHTGLSFAFADNWMASLAYAHCFQNEVSGTRYGLAAETLTTRASADVVSLGFSKRF